MTSCDKPYGYCELLEELKKQGLSEEEAIRELDGKHWTDWHPDRRDWDPDQKGTVAWRTQKAYEGLYGRGRPPGYVCPCEAEEDAPGPSEASEQDGQPVEKRLAKIEEKLDRLIARLGA